MEFLVALQSAAAPLKSDAAQGKPSVGVHSEATRRRGRVTDYSKAAAADCENAVGEIGSGSYDVAASDIKAPTSTENVAHPGWSSRPCPQPGVFCCLLTIIVFVFDTT